MHNSWIWQHPSWPEFTFDQSALLPGLERCIQRVAPLKHLCQALTQEQRLDWEAAILLDETLASAKIEGEYFDRDSVRSSIASKLGIGESIRFDKHSDAMVELLLRSIRFSDERLSEAVIKDWHQLLFPAPPLLTPLTIGNYRNDEMQILSGRYGKQTIHYLAPGATRAEVNAEMTRFFNWLNTPPGGSAYIRAAIAKFWFVTIHPFDDGNGRLSRVIAERCLAEAENTRLRLYSLSSVFEDQRAEYYRQLEQCQKGSLDLTAWIRFFLSSVEQAACNAKHEFERVVQRTRFWQTHHQTPFNSRQQKLLKRLLESRDFPQGISRKKYKALAKTTDATAGRDLADLVEKKILLPQGQGRTRRYRLR